jgi:hypothetical protein
LRVEGWGLQDKGLGFTNVQSRVWDSGSRVYEFRVQGLGFMAWGFRGKGVTGLVFRV